MKVFEKSYKTNNDLGLATGLNFDTSNMCVFDIETTGLHYDRSKVILTAMLMPSEFGYTITQYLAENHYEENKVIDATLKFFEDNKIEYLVTFNGGGFDIDVCFAQLITNQYWLCRQFFIFSQCLPSLVI